MRLRHCSLTLNRVTVLAIIVSVAVCPGCSFLVSDTQAVTVSASEPQAELFADGQLIGRGTAVAHLRRNCNHTFMARLGDRSSTAEIGHRMSSVGILDVVGGFLLIFPFLGILAPGFWTLDTESVSIAVPPATR